MQYFFLFTQYFSFKEQSIFYAQLSWALKRFTISSPDHKLNKISRGRTIQTHVNILDAILLFMLVCQ